MKNWFPNFGSWFQRNTPYSSHASMLGLNPAYAYGSGGTAAPALPSAVTFEESRLGKLVDAARQKFSENSPKVKGYLKEHWGSAAIGSVMGAGTKMALRSALHSVGGGVALAAAGGGASLVTELTKDYYKALKLAKNEERRWGKKYWDVARTAVRGNGKKYLTKSLIGAASGFIGGELMGHLMSSTHLTDHLPSMHMPSFLTRAVDSAKELLGHHPAPSLAPTHAADIALSAPVTAPLSVPVALPELSLHDQLADLAQNGHLDKHAQATLALALKGNLGAQREMADSMLNHGRFGFAENKKLAVSLLKKLGGEGDLKSQANLAYLRAQKKFAGLVDFDPKAAHNWFVPKTGLPDLTAAPTIADSSHIADLFPATPIPALSAESFRPAFAAAKEAMSCAATPAVDGSMLTDCAPTGENFIPGNTIGLKVMFNNGVQKVWDLLIGPDASTMSTGQYLKKAIGSALEKVQSGSDVLALNLNKD